MPSTTNFGWTTPADTDLVKDGAAAIRTLGNGVDASFVDLKGGTTGQVLSKNSNTDLDFTWVAQDDSNAIQNAIVDAKGDLITATAADTPARLAVGTNGQVLTADSTQSTGLKWAAASGGATKYPAIGQNYYAVTGTTTTAEGQIYLDENGYTPVYLPACTLTRIAIRTASTFSGTSSVRLGIYNNSANNLPSTVLLDAGTVSCTASSSTYEITISQVVTAGLYWLVARTVTAATNNNYRCIGGSPTLIDQTETNNISAKIYGFTQTQTGVFATASSLLPANTTGQSCAIVGVRIS